MIAVVRVRGLIGRDRDVEATLKTLRIHRRNYCTLVEETPDVKGMLLKAKDFITWGNVDAETEKALKDKSDKKFYRLNSPRKGYGRKGIKMPFSKGGALGNRKEKISDLIKRML